ncbi:MAG: type II toxin-antitoxin system PemK/MazF family toxin [Acetobacteraceae bacterium]|nr:type II toxin-antitoxin system PemK/MazF family toxin [Acetobacteraceae bacterium]
MRRGDIVTVSVPGDYGKPRPAVVIQSDRLAETDSVLLCLVTTTIRDAPLYRIGVSPGPVTGLRDESQVMVDKIMAVKRANCGQPVGRLEHPAMLALNRTLALVTGLAD